MTGNINSNFNERTISTDSLKRKRDDEQETLITQEIQFEKDLSNEAGLETLVCLFQSLKLCKLSTTAQNIINKIVASLNQVTISNAKDLCFEISNLLEEFCSVTSYETYQPEEQRTVNFMHRACQKACLLCQQGRFSPSVARETYFCLVLDEFFLEADTTNITPWLKTFLKNNPFHKNINTVELAQLGWGNNEILLLIKHSTHMNELNLSGSLNLDLTQIIFHEGLTSISLSSKQILNQNLFKTIAERCLYLEELNIDTINKISLINHFL